MASLASKICPDAHNITKLAQKTDCCCSETEARPAAAPPRLRLGDGDGERPAVTPLRLAGPYAWCAGGAGASLGREATPGAVRRDTAEGDWRGQSRGHVTACPAALSGSRRLGSVCPPSLAPACGPRDPPGGRGGPAGRVPARVAASRPGRASRHTQRDRDAGGRGTGGSVGDGDGEGTARGDALEAGRAGAGREELRPAARQRWSNTGQNGSNNDQNGQSLGERGHL